MRYFREKCVLDSGRQLKENKDKQTTNTHTNMKEVLKTFINRVFSNSSTIARKYFFFTSKLQIYNIYRAIFFPLRQVAEWR